MLLDVYVTPGTVTFFGVNVAVSFFDCFVNILSVFVLSLTLLTGVPTLTVHFATLFVPFTFTLITAVP